MRGESGEIRLQHPPPRRGANRHRKGHEATEGEDETEEEEEEEVEDNEERDRDGETPRGDLVEVTRMGGDATPLEENTDLPGFTPERVHLLLQGVYGYFPHHNDGSHLDGWIADYTVC